MFLRSLQGRLLIVLLLVVAAAISAGTLMLELFRQSASARVGQAEAQIGRACDAIGAAYRFYLPHLPGAPGSSDAKAIGEGLSIVVSTALRDRNGFEGGIWRDGRESLAYAFPTYEGSGPKTDLPEAELPRIRQANQQALSEDRLVESQYQSASQALLISACPLPGPIPRLTAWTMTRVTTFAGPAYQQLMTGLVVLLVAVATAAVLLIRLTVTWSRHISRIEGTLAIHDIGELPKLAMSGERELDRIVTALNDAGARLSESRRRADELAREVATGQRLSAIGRVVAGVAHEIRNPIAAMRLKAENALASQSGTRDREALAVIVGQIDRLDRLVRRLLNVTERDDPQFTRVPLATFLDTCTGGHAELAASRGITLESRTDVESACFDSEQMRRAVDNLILNALEAAPAGSGISIGASVRDSRLVVSVHDRGAGPPENIRDHLFEPFVTGRADGTGLGLSIVREVAEAHGGIARLAPYTDGTVFEIIIPWQES